MTFTKSQAMAATRKMFNALKKPGFTIVKNSFSLHKGEGYGTAPDWVVHFKIRKPRDAKIPCPIIADIIDRSKERSIKTYEGAPSTHGFLHFVVHTNVENNDDDHYIPDYYLDCYGWYNWVNDDDCYQKSRQKSCG